MLRRARDRSRSCVAAAHGRRARRARRRDRAAVDARRRGHVRRRRRSCSARSRPAVAALPGTKVVTAAQVADAIKKAKKPQLKGVRGRRRVPRRARQAGRRADRRSPARSAASASRASSTSARPSRDRPRSCARRRSRSAAQADAGGGPSGAAVRLLDPDRYRGTLHFAIDVTGATVYVNGTQGRRCREGRGRPARRHAGGPRHASRVPRLRALHRRAPTARPPRSPVGTAAVPDRPARHPGQADQPRHDHLRRSAAVAALVRVGPGRRRPRGRRGRDLREPPAGRGLALHRRRRH